MASNAFYYTSGQACPLNNTQYFCKLMFVVSKLQESTISVIAKNEVIFTLE